MAPEGQLWVVNNIIGPRTIATEFAQIPNVKVFRVNALDKNGNPTWSYYTKEYYDAMLIALGWAEFETEFQNNPHKSGKIFKNEYFQWRPALPLRAYKRLAAYWDIAYSESSTADTNAVAFIGLLTDQVHLLKAFCRNCTMEDALRWMYHLDKLCKKAGLYVEWYAEQQFWNKTVETSIGRVAKEEGYRLSIAFIDRPGRGQNKYARILELLPPLQRGEVYISESEKFNTDMQRGLEQLKGIEPGYTGKDDFPDALSGCHDKLGASMLTENAVPITGDRPAPKNLH